MRYSELEAGMALIADSGFNCLKEGQYCPVIEDKDGFFVYCKCGRHYLERQIDGEGFIVGLEYYE